MGTPVTKISVFIFLIYWFCPFALPAQAVNNAGDTAAITSILAIADKAQADSAIALNKRAISIAEKNLKSVTNKTLRKVLTHKLIQAQLGLGLAYYQQLGYDKSLELFQKALQSAVNLNEPSLLGECYFDIAEVHLEQSHFSDAMANYRYALEQYHKARDLQGEFWCHTGMGIVQKQIGNYRDAIHCYNTALEVAQNAGLKTEEASGFNNLGNVYRKQGDFAKAMESYQKAIEAFRVLKDDDAVSDCLNNIGNLYLDNGDPFRALDYYRKSLKIAEANKDEYRLIIRYKNLAGAYTELKDFENAELYLKDALKLAEKSGDKSFLASCNMLFGKLHSEKDDFIVASAYYKKSVQLYADIGAAPEQSEALIQLAYAQLDDNQVKAAKANALAASALAARTGSLKTRLDADLCLAKCYEKANETDKAYEFLSKATSLKDSIFTLEKNRTIEEIEAGFARSELKKENEALTQNSILQKQAIRTRNVILLLLGVSLLLGAALLRLIYKQRRDAQYEASTIKRQSELKIEQLNNDLTAKERELTSKTIFINQKNQLLEKLISELDVLRNSDVSAQSIQHLQLQLKQELSPNTWKEFEVQFNEVHPGFQQRLLEKYPVLTPAERRLCSFIRLNMNTREISSLTGQSIKSIEVARTRIRKKIGVPHEQNLSNYIALL